MSQKKHNKRRVSPTVAAKKQARAEQLADEKDRARKRMDPTARNLLFGDLIFLAICELMVKLEVISPFLAGIATIVGILLLLLALWFQFGRGGGGGRRTPLG